jgi:RimJ/RimL family protein N-acetyltransferase
VSIEAGSKRLAASVRIAPWSATDRDLLEGLLGDPAMTAHLGGPESPERLAQRQARYAMPGSGQFRIVDAEENSVGYVGFWERSWHGEQIWEVGWAVLPDFQGRGVATEAMNLLLEIIRNEHKGRAVHAFPSVDNGPSNAVCRKLGFENLGAHDFEYPPGNAIRCNDWRLDI